MRRMRSRGVVPLAGGDAKRRFGLPDANAVVRPRALGAPPGAFGITTGIRTGGATRNKLPRILSRRDEKLLFRESGC